MGRKRAISIRTRVLATLLLVALVAAGYGWWRWVHWVPDRADYPVQGAQIGAGDGRLDFRALAAVGANFVYLDASEGADRRDPLFGRNLDHADRIGMPVGAVHVFDPCIPAERQAANFVTTVPRDREMLPPAIALDADAGACDSTAGDAAVESELMTFLNQVEAHVGQPAILKLGPDFEDRYGLAAQVERSLWVTGDLREPGYAGRPFALWTANHALRTEASERPIRWVVARR